MSAKKDSLSARITHARSTSNPSPEFEFDDFRSLIENRNSSDVFLTYYSSEGNSVALTYRVFYQFVRETAAFFETKGLAEGDRIATVSVNYWHTVVQYFAAWYCGLVVVPINTGEDDSRISYILQKAGVKLALVREGNEGRIGDIIKSNVITGLEVVACGDNIEDFTTSVNNPPTSEPRKGNFSEHDGLIVFTSGTTGNPKGVVLTQRNLLEDARAISLWHKIDKSTKMMCVLPIHHVNGTVVTLITPFFAGASVVLNEKFKASKFFEVISREKVNIVSVVPTLLQFLNNEYEDKSPPAYPSLSHIICGAGPLTITVAENFEKRFGVRIIHGYGLSETTCYSCYLPLDLIDEDHAEWMRSHGYPSIGVALGVNEMDIHDADGNPVGDDVRGEIVIRGYNVMREYYANESANEAAFTFGWFRSGDEGFTKSDKQGRRFFFITGRLKELIIRGGVNLAPLEIDEIIGKAPGVKAGISVGFENDWYGEEVGAYVQLEEGADEDTDSIIAYCREFLPHAKCPKVIVFGDQIPVTSTGKYQRMKVAHLFKEWKTVQFRR